MLTYNNSNAILTLSAGADRKEDDMDEMTTQEILDKLISLRYNLTSTKDKMLIDEIEIKMLKLKELEKKGE